jgi:hypothetical protein
MNILFSCDENYYNIWGINLIKSINFYNPWIKITCIFVGNDNIDKIDKVDYVFDDINLLELKDPIAYFQAVRFLKCSEIFSNNELVMSIDCDTLCTEKFNEKEFIDVCNNIYVQRHQKDKRWMAGLVTYGADNNFRNRFKEKLLEIPIENWPWGHDQTVLNKLSEEFDYNKLFVGDWMSFGRGRGTFLTLKGDQKTSPGYLNNYNESLKQVTN